MEAPSKAEAIIVLERGHNEIERLLRELTPEAMFVTGIGGGAWSPKDLLGHLALWHEIALRTIDEHRRGDRPWIVDVFAAPGPGPNDEELAKRAGWSLERAREAYDGSLATVIEALGGIGEEAWGSSVDGWADQPATLGGLLGVVLGKEEVPFGHAFAHVLDLAAFVGEHGRI